MLVSAMPKLSVFWSPDELCCLACIILPWWTQTIQIYTSVSGAQSLSCPLSFQSPTNFPDYVFSWCDPRKLSLTDSFDHCSLYPSFCQYFFITVVLSPQNFSQKSYTRNLHKFLECVLHSYASFLAPTRTQLYLVQKFFACTWLKLWGFDWLAVFSAGVVYHIRTCFADRTFRCSAPQLLPSGTLWTLILCAVAF